MAAFISGSVDGKTNDSGVSDFYQISAQKRFSREYIEIINNLFDVK